MSNYFFCHNVFKSRLLERHQKVSLCDKGLKQTDTCLGRAYFMYRGKVFVYYSVHHIVGVVIERPSQVRQVAGLVPGRVIPKT